MDLAVPGSPIRMTQSSTHEQFEREELGGPGSERGFAGVIAGALAGAAALNGWHSGRAWPWLLAVAVALLAVGFVRPAVLKPLNRLWFKLGVLLHAVVNPIIMAFVFYGAVLPTALVMRAFGKDTLHLKVEPDRTSYWIARQPNSPAPESMRDQF